MIHPALSYLRQDRIQELRTLVFERVRTQTTQVTQEFNSILYYKLRNAPKETYAYQYLYYLLLLLQDVTYLSVIGTASGKGNVTGLHCFGAKFCLSSSQLTAFKFTCTNQNAVIA